MEAIIDVDEARNKLPELIERAIAGEQVIISRWGKPVVRLVPYSANRKPRKLGIWKGKVRIAPDFDETPVAFRVLQVRP